MDEVVRHLFSEGRARCDVGWVVPEFVRLVGIVREPEVLQCRRQVADRVIDTGDHIGG